MNPSRKSLFPTLGSQTTIHERIKAVAFGGRGIPVAYSWVYSRTSRVVRGLTPGLLAVQVFSLICFVV